MAYNDYEDNKKTRTSARTGMDGTSKTGTTATLGVVGIVVAIALAIAGWFYFNGKEGAPSTMGHSVSDKLKTVGNKAKDVAAEVPQAASDAVTKGDQNTTRPNSDNSTRKLDQN